MAEIVHRYDTLDALADQLAETLAELPAHGAYQLGNSPLFIRRLGGDDRFVLVQQQGTESLCASPIMDRAAAVRWLVRTAEG